MSAALRELLAKATPGPWELATSCSWRRIVTTHGRAEMKFEIQRNEDTGEVSFRGSYTMHELAKIKLDPVERGMLRQNADEGTAASDMLLALETIYRRHEEQST